MYSLLFPGSRLLPGLASLFLYLLQAEGRAACNSRLFVQLLTSFQNGCSWRGESSRLSKRISALRKRLNPAPFYDTVIFNSSLVFVHVVELRARITLSNRLILLFFLIHSKIQVPGYYHRFFRFLIVDQFCSRSLFSITVLKNLEKQLYFSSKEINIRNLITSDSLKSF